MTPRCSTSCGPAFRTYKLDGRPIKEICKGTGQLFRHLKNCNNDLWLQLQLSSKHSMTQLDEEGELMQVSLDPVTVLPRSHTSSHLYGNSTVRSRVSRTLSRTGLLQRKR